MVQLKELGLVSDGVSLCCVSFYPRVNNVLLYGLGFSSNKVSAPGRGEGGLCVLGKTPSYLAVKVLFRVAH